MPKRKNPSLSVGRGEKLPVSRGGGLTAKGRAKYNKATGSKLKAPQKSGPRHKSFCARSKVGRASVVRLPVKDGVVVKELVTGHPQRGSYPCVLVVPKVLPIS